MNLKDLWQHVTKKNVIDVIETAIHLLSEVGDGAIGFARSSRAAQEPVLQIFVGEVWRCRQRHAASRAVGTPNEGVARRLREDAANVLRRTAGIR